MKAKLQGKKPSSSSKEEAPTGTTSKPLPASSTKQLPASAKPAPAVKEKPSLPVINEQSLHHYYAEPLPSFRDVAPSEKQLLFVQKLHLCSFTFDFTDPSKNVKEKEIKRQTLLELVDYANSGQGKFTEAVSEDIIFMISQNLFRTLPPSRSHDVDNFDPEEEEPMLEPGWPHLQVSLKERSY
jgi:serine/threonine-protein phosphatase 2A regulatory subunit B'